LPALQTAANLGKFGGTNQLPQIPSGNRPAPPLTTSRGVPPITNPSLRTPPSSNFAPSSSDFIFSNKPTGPVSFQSQPIPNFIPSNTIKQPPIVPLNSSAEFSFVPNSRLSAPLSKNDSEFNLGGEDFPALPTNPLSYGQPFSKTSSYEAIPSGMRPVPSAQPVSYEFRGPPLMQPPKIQKPYVPDRYGLLGLLNVIRMTDQDLNILALGTDLTTLGLNLNSADSLYNTFASPWADSPSRREPEFHIPTCYQMQTPPQSALAKMHHFSEEILFYIFYSMPKDVLQLAAATELYKRDWRYSKEHRLWLTPVSQSEVTKSNGIERGSFIFFDPNTWEKVRRDNFSISLDQLETQPPRV
jgi:hypothetical protein